MLGLFGPKSDKIELYRTAILYLDPPQGERFYGVSSK